MMRGLEQSNPQGWKIEEGCGWEGGLQGWCLMATAFQFRKKSSARVPNTPTALLCPCRSGLAQPQRGRPGPVLRPQTLPGRPMALRSTPPFLLPPPAFPPLSLPWPVPASLLLPFSPSLSLPSTDISMAACPTRRKQGPVHPGCPLLLPPSVLGLLAVSPTTPDSGIRGHWGMGKGGTPLIFSILTHEVTGQRASP